MIYVTGDIHGGFDIHKLSSKELRSAGLRIKKMTTSLSAAISVWYGTTNLKSAIGGNGLMKNHGLRCL